MNYYKSDTLPADCTGFTYVYSRVQGKFYFCTLDDILDSKIEKVDKSTFMQAVGACPISTDKPTILANGEDTATITISGIPSKLFINYEEITVPEDGTLEITATTPGVMRVVAGPEIPTKENEVVIDAIEASK